MVIWSVLLLTGAFAIAALIRALSAIRRVRHQAEEIALTKAELRRSAHAQALLLRSVRAELDDPVSSIHAHAQLLLGGWRGTLSLDQSDSLHRIRSAAESLRNLSMDVECLGALDAGGGIRLTLEPVDIREVVHTTADEHEIAARCYRQRIVVRFAAVSQIRTDEAHVKHVVSNMVSRAILHSPPGGSIELYGQNVMTRLTLDQPERQFVSISLLSGEDPKRIDELDRVLSEVDNGMRPFATPGGLRLSVSVRLARLLGGNLTVSRKNGRLFFCLILPSE